MDLTQTKFSLSRPIQSYSKIQKVYSDFIRNKRWQLAKLNVSKNYLNVGCGFNLNEQFINLDYQWRPNLDLCWDIRHGIPLESNSVNGIYSEHCLEHITFEQVQKVLTEFYRLLKPQGNVRIIVPDAELYINLYNRSRNGETVQFPYTEKENKDDFSPIMSINSVFRDHGHLYAYDFDCLALMLKKAGFELISKECFMKGRDPILLIDSEYRKVESLYIEGTKSF